MGGRNAVNEATERLARTSVGSYKALMDNTMALQERNVRFALGIIHGSLGQLRRQVESNQSITADSSSAPRSSKTPSRRSSGGRPMPT